MTGPISGELRAFSVFSCIVCLPSPTVAVEGAVKHLELTEDAVSSDKQAYAYRAMLSHLRATKRAEKRRGRVSKGPHKEVYAVASTIELIPEKSETARKTTREQKKGTTKDVGENTQNEMCDRSGSHGTPAVVKQEIQETSGENPESTQAKVTSSARSASKPVSASRRASKPVRASRRRPTTDAMAAKVANAEQTRRRRAGEPRRERSARKRSMDEFTDEPAATLAPRTRRRQKQHELALAKPVE